MSPLNQGHDHQHLPTATLHFNRRSQESCQGQGDRIWAPSPGIQGGPQARATPGGIWPTFARQPIELPLEPTTMATCNGTTKRCSWFGCNSRIKGEAAVSSPLPNLAWDGTHPTIKCTCEMQLELLRVDWNKGILENIHEPY